MATTGVPPGEQLGIEPKPVSVAVPSIGVRKATLGFKIRDYGGSFLFVLPYLLFSILFLFGPIVYAFILSLHNWDTIAGDQGFVGLRHYNSVLFNRNSIFFDDFWSGMRHTALFVVISVPLLVGLALILALLLAEAPWRSFFRAAFYIPAVLSVTIASTIWLWIFQNGGVISTVFNTSVSFLATQPYAWLAIIVCTMWWTVGFNMVILLAGIIEVPKDYHEAAKIDGANGLQRILFITIPILRPILAFVAITTMLASFGLFGQEFLMTGGGPALSTKGIIHYIYDGAFRDNNLAMACTMSFCMGLILIILSVTQLKFFRASEA